MKEKGRIKMTPSVQVNNSELYVIHEEEKMKKNTHKHHVHVYYLPYLICLWANKAK